MPSNQASQNNNPLLPNLSFDPFGMPNSTLEIESSPHLRLTPTGTDPITGRGRAIAGTEPLHIPEVDLFGATTSLLGRTSHSVFFEPVAIGHSSSSSNTDILTGRSVEDSLVGGLTAGDRLTGITASQHQTISNTGVSSNLSGANLIGQSVETQLLTLATLEIFRQEAIARWAALGLDSFKLAMLESATLRIDDLSGTRLGLKSRDTITLDINAAGQGWFIDLTPSDDREFSTRVSESELLASRADSPFRRVDLLTVLAHEMGHLIGLDHPESGNGADNLMNAIIPTGVRRLPTQEDFTFAHSEPNDTLEEAGEADKPDLIVTDIGVVA